MNEEIIQSIASELKISVSQVQNTLSMLEEGNTVPFIARYRKEQTKGLDEEQILFIQKKYDYQLKLAERKESVLKLIEEQGKLTDEIRESVAGCTKLSQVEDIYRPYAQKKKTRAATAIKNGLQPLADWMLSLPEEGDLVAEAGKYLGENVANVKDAIQGAMDIIAEVVSDNPQQRWAFKDNIMKTGVLTSKLKKDAQDEKKVYQNYYDYSEKISTIADHRIMALDRAEKEKVITVSFVFDEEHLKEDIELVNSRLFAVLETASEEKMKTLIEEAAAQKDSVGGILETAVYGLEAGIGEPMFDTLEGVLAKALFAVPAVKGVQFGSGFAFADMYGSQANDPFAVKDGTVQTLSNHNGGINGGISNGMSIRFETVIKPTPSIGRKQATVDLETMTNTEIEIRGRHDPAVIHRARAVVDAVTALAVADLLMEKYGRAGFEEGHI